jgi:hypothetical protein
VPITAVNTGLHQTRLEDRRPGLHRLGRDQHLGDEVLAVAEQASDLGHALQQPVVQDLTGPEAVVESLFDQAGDSRLVPFQHCLGDLLELRHLELQRADDPESSEITIAPNIVAASRGLQ